eukprot:Opistho-2@79731
MHTALLTGPSGTGKTTIVHRLASACGASVLAPTPAAIAASYPGEPERGVCEWVARARIAAPCVLLLDDADTMFPYVDGDQGGESMAERRLALALGAALEAPQPPIPLSSSCAAVLVVVVAVDSSRVDPIVSGRADVHIAVSAPSPALRMHILSECLGGSLPEWAGEVLERCQGMSGAQLAALVRDAHAYHLLSLADSGYDGVPDESIGNCIASREDFHACLDRLRRPAGLTENQTVTGWGDVAGLTDVKAALEQAVTWTHRHAAALSRMGISPPKGVLLYGPPGTGKTLLARVVACESGASFFALAIPDLLRSEVGESERILRETFAAARHSRPSVVFMDEVQALFGSRGGPGGGGVNRTLVTQLIVEMDALDVCPGVVVLGATNAPHAIDSALLSAGRFERALFVPPPDASARRHILSSLRNAALRGGATTMPVWADSVDVEELVALTDGFTGADLRSLARQAAVESFKRRIALAETRQTDVTGDLLQMALSALGSRPPGAAIDHQDFTRALGSVMPSVGEDEVRRMRSWRPYAQGGDR